MRWKKTEQNDVGNEPRLRDITDGYKLFPVCCSQKSLGITSIRKKEGKKKTYSLHCQTRVPALVMPVHSKIHTTVPDHTLHAHEATLCTMQAVLRHRLEVVSYIPVLRTTLL